ncbi:caspase-2 [Pyxicephalus adspersus]|uniref:caspase-2 n=1 Tax=Pyxicephalus adspersus TaxID=30357 RepID=UPI003B59864D
MTPRDQVGRTPITVFACSPGRRTRKKRLRWRCLGLLHEDECRDDAALDIRHLRTNRLPRDLRMLGGMKECHKAALIKLRVTLATQLQPEDLLEHLLADRVLTPIMKENIEVRKFPLIDPVYLVIILHFFNNHCNHFLFVSCQVLILCFLYLQETHIPMSVQETIPRGRPSLECCEMSLDDGDGPVSVSQTRVDFFLSHHRQAYRMSSLPRGLALIISNIQFSDPELGYRQGGEVDEASLKHLFSSFNYQVVFKSDLTAQKIMSELISFSSRPEHSHMDSAIVAILSHGVDGAIYGTDSQMVKLQDIFTILDNAHCPQLQNKPKMFFIQACRGVEADRGVDQRDGRDQTSSPSCEQSDAGREYCKVRLPTQSDMICAYACLKGTVSLRNTKRGSWFIQDLVEVFSKYAKDTHVADMLVKVNACIKKREGHAPGTEFDRCKEMSEYCSTLCKDLYLFPGILIRSNSSSNI